MNYIGEAEFTQKAEDILEPFMRDKLKGGQMDGFDGTKIQYYRADGGFNKNIVIVHGYNEFIYKYLEMIYYLFESGYNVFFIEHRGFGESERQVVDKTIPYVKSFDEYVADLKVFMDKIVKPATGDDDVYFLAHSMGGCIASLFQERHPGYVQKMVLSSPMLRLRIDEPQWKITALVLYAKLLHKQKQRGMGHGFTGVNEWETSSSVSKSRYDYQLKKRTGNEDYQTSGTSFGWFIASIPACKEVQENEAKITVPVMILSAGKDHLVDVTSHDEFVERKPETKHVVFPESKHEIMNASPEDMKKYYDEIFEFLG